MTPEFHEAQDALAEAAEQRSREAGISFDAALQQLKAEGDPAYLAYEENHPNEAARKGAFIARQMRDGGSTRAEADRLWERQEARRLNAEQARRGRSFRLSAAHADGDIAIPIIE
jgi:hypothetical protein